MSKRQTCVGALLLGLMLAGCQSPGNKWTPVLGHDSDGRIEQGAVADLIAVVRSGCQVRVAWGARRAADPNRTIEHAAEPVWVSVRNGENVEVQLDDFLINLGVLGEPPEDHPRRAQFGGTKRAVKWRANLKTDGTFNAVWYYPHSGEFIYRVPQRYSMKWFADCSPGSPAPLYSIALQ